MTTVTITARRLNGLERAEEFCRAYRKVITMRHCDREQRHWDAMFKRFTRWMDVAPKSRYDDPKGWAQ